MRGVERRMTRMMRLVDRVSADVLHDKVGVVVKIQDVIIQSRLLEDINSQILEVMKVEVTGKRKKG